MNILLKKTLFMVYLMTSATIVIAETPVSTDLVQALEQAQTRTNNALITVPAAKVEQDKFAKPAERHYKIGDHLYGTQGSSWGIQNNAATIQQGRAVQSCQVVGESVSCN
ncbi:MAG: hypothetical protein QNL15_15470 [Pseudomonadales bacterium]|jgi:hypothetical protein|tara:strand:+ start:210 stop:539 length:330 start_codon:yes stop_codon:yes gene_type:complete